MDGPQGIGLGWAAFGEHHDGMRTPFRHLRLVLLSVFVPCVGALLAVAQAPGAVGGPQPNLGDTIEKPLRYRPDGPDFVIENGAEFFNRPLYGGNTAFRVDAGDRPEFALYLPGRGGNLRLGFRTAAGAKWCHDAATVVARYRPGEMLYEIRDPWLGSVGTIQLTAVALAQAEGLVVRVAASGLDAGAELFWAYGGVTGERGRRDGDIGTEAVPISEWFQLRPDFCRGNVFAFSARSFTVQAKVATIVGLTPEGAVLAAAEAAQWNDCAALFAAAEPGVAAPQSSPAEPVVVGRVALRNARPLLLGLQRVGASPQGSEDLATYREVRGERPGEQPVPASKPVPAFAPEDLPRLFAEAESHFAALRNRVRIETPDPFLDAAVGALNVAADAVWDEPQGAIMHGAIAWRTKLLGWRGPYALDALGWHERARKHFADWAVRQNTDPVPASIPPADESSHLARSEAALHSNGDLSASHYDMNLVYIDALFRHLLWTGDLGLARELWPMIERHLAWERRLFRREFGPEKLPLYEAYAAIWASDDLQYHGGGTAHASAYNYWHNRMAARLAQLLGHDAATYEREAELIGRAMREFLWLPADGMFAESKDLLGRQLVHPSAALWTFYHTLDAELPTPAEAWAMARYADARLPHLPVRGPGVPTDAAYHVLATTEWMPYSWSINNVVMGENLHTALGFWQAGRAEEAFRLTKSALLASMYLGICPGNVGSMNYLDVYRRESQRDFADGSGVLSRAVVEGLFGVRPDALRGELRLRPGFPVAWEHARLTHPEVDLDFRREGAIDRYRIKLRFPRPLALRLELAVRGETARVTLNGAEVAARILDLPELRLEIDCPSADATEIAVTWTGVPRPVAAVPTAQAERKPAMVSPSIDWRAPFPVAARLDAVDMAPFFNDMVTEIFRPGKYRTPRSPLCSLALPAQGIGAWAGHVNATAEIDDSGLRRVAAANAGRLVLPNGVPFATPGPGAAPNVVFVSQWDNYPREATLPVAGRARRAFLLLAGSTNWMQSRLDNGEVVATYADGSTARLALRNPETWWPIEQDYFIDDYQFRCDGPLPPRVDLRTGRVRLLDLPAFKGQGRAVPGGAATVLVLPLDPGKELRSLTVRALANEVVIGLLAATLER